METLAWLVIAILVLSFLGMAYAVATAEEVPSDHPDFDHPLRDRERLP